MRLKGNIQGQKVTVLVDGGATQNFIDAALVERKKFQDEICMVSQSSFQGTIIWTALNGFQSFKLL